MKSGIAFAAGFGLVLCAAGAAPAFGQTAQTDDAPGFLEYSPRSGHADSEPGCPDIEKVGQTAQFPVRALEDHISAGIAQVQFHVTENGAAVIDKLELSDGRFQTAAFAAVKRVRCNRASVGRTFHWRIDFVLPAHDPLPADTPLTTLTFTAPLPSMLQQLIDQSAK